MALTTYAAIQAAVQERCGTDSTVLTASRIDDMLWSVEAEIWAKLRTRENRDMYTFTYAAGGVAFLTVEAAILLDIIGVDVVISSGDVKAPLPMSEFALRRALAISDTRNPEGFGWFSQADGTTKLVIAPEPVGATVYVSYWKKFATLSSATNAVFLAYPHIWLHGLTAEGFLGQQDIDMYMVWKDRFDKSIEAVNFLNRGANESLKGNTTGPVYRPGMTP